MMTMGTLQTNRIPIEGKFGQSKRRYSLDRIMSKLAVTSGSTDQRDLPGYESGEVAQRLPLIFVFSVFCAESKELAEKGQPSSSIFNLEVVG